jgi:deazaflavin-dependent oxidoreductase (nitroreductase family)
MQWNANERQTMNQRVVDEFRANHGRVGGPFEGRPMILITTKGARSGQLRTTPLVCLKDGDRYLIFASKAGAPTNPAWYHNLVAHPTATVELGTERFEVRAEVTRGEERDRLFRQQAERVPQFGDYQRRTTRPIPVIALTRA